MKQKILSILNSNWTVTLISTTVGVYLGIFMNEHYRQKAELHRADDAFEDVLSELQDNYEGLLEWDSISTQNYGFFSQLAEYIENYDEMIVQMTVGQMQQIRTAYPKFLAIEDSTLVKDSTYLYDCTFDLDFNSNLAFLQHYEIAWSSIKDTEYMRLLDFNCIKSIEFFYRMYSYSNDVRNKWMKPFFDGKNRAETLDEMLRDWKMENQVNQMLIQSYPEIKKILQECI